MIDQKNHTLVAFFSALLLAFSLSWTSQAQAVALGDITLNSSLNEPLDASIELIQLNGLDESLILIGLASDQDFARVGIDRPSFLQGIRFEVVVQNSSSGIVYLTTEDPIVEPYMDFIIDLRWSSGRMQREYTVLLDLPVFSVAPVSPEPVQAPQLEEQNSPQSVQQVIRTEPAPVLPVPEEGVVNEEPEQQVTTRPVIVEDEVQDPTFDQAPEGEYTVQIDDTLWEIALQTRPDSSVSVHQMMLAIQRENQDAFIGDNINLLRAGQVLRVPDYDRILNIGQQEAINEVALQNQEFNGGGLDVQPLAVNNNQFNQGGDQVADELAVLSEDDAQLDASAAQDMSARITALENQLMLSEENLDRASLENQELVARLADLNAQIDLLENIIAIEDQRIAELQLELANRVEPLVDAADAALAGVDSEVVAGGGADQSVEVADTAANDQEESEPVAQVSSVRSAAQSESIVDKVLSALDNTLILVGIGGLLILLVVGVLVMRKRREEDYDDEDYNSAYQVSSVRDEFDTEDIERLESFDDEDQELVVNLDSEMDNSSIDDNDEESRDKSDSDAGVLSALGSMIGRNDDLDTEESIEVTIEDSELDIEPDIEIDLDGDSAESLDDDQDPGTSEQSNNLEDTLNAIDQLAEKGDVELGDEIAEPLTVEIDSIDSGEDDSPSLDFVLNDEPSDPNDQAVTSTGDDDLESFEFSVAPVGEDKSAESDLEQDLDIEEIEVSLSDSPSTDSEEKQSSDEDDDGVFDLGNLTLDENAFTDDVVLADDEDESESLDDDKESLASKIDLAIAYEAMGDMSGAQAELDKVIANGTGDQVTEAKKLLEEWKES